MEDKLIIKYIAGQATPEEKERILTWIEQAPENQQKYNRLKNTWVMCHLPQQKTSAAEARQYTRSLKRPSRFRPYIGYGIAASLILLISFSLLRKIESYKSEIAFLKNQEMVNLDYRTNKGVKGKVTLPDGSVVWLNSDSELNCPGQFSGDHREILFSGEGFFDIVKNPEKPMIIKLENDLQVIVRGTKFNLASYKNDDNVSALLLSGNITVQRTRNNKREEIKVKPNEQIRILKKEMQEAILSVPAVTMPILGWKDGWLIFDETPISEVLKKLERWHGITFDVRNPEILTQKFTARFHEESISQILEMMNRVALLRYELRDKTAILYKY